MPCAWRPSILKLPGRLSEMMDGRKASKVSLKIARAVDDFCVSHDLPTLEDASSARAKKRKGEDGDEGTPAKAARAADEGSSNGAQQPGGFQAMTPEQIREIMNKTKREIAQRMAQLNTAKESNQARMVGPQKPPPEAGKAALPPPGVAIPGVTAGDDKAQALAALQARIASSLNKVGDKLSVPTR